MVETRHQTAAEASSSHATDLGLGENVILFSPNVDANSDMDAHFIDADATQWPVIGHPSLSIHQPAAAADGRLIISTSSSLRMTVSSLRRRFYETTTTNRVGPSHINGPPTTLARATHSQSY